MKDGIKLMLHTPTLLDAIEATHRNIFDILLGKIGDTIREKNLTLFPHLVYGQQYEKTSPKICERVSDIDSNLGRYIKHVGFLRNYLPSIRKYVKHQSIHPIITCKEDIHNLLCEPTTWMSLNDTN